MFVFILCSLVQSFLFSEVFSGTFWMGAFGGATAKRHRLWSNCQELLAEVVKQGGPAQLALMYVSASVHSFKYCAPLCIYISVSRLSQVDTLAVKFFEVCQDLQMASSKSTLTKRAVAVTWVCRSGLRPASILAAILHFMVCKKERVMFCFAQKRVQFINIGPYIFPAWCSAKGLHS